MSQVKLKLFLEKHHPRGISSGHPFLSHLLATTFQILSLNILESGLVGRQLIKVGEHDDFLWIALCGHTHFVSTRLGGL